MLSTNPAHAFFTGLDRVSAVSSGQHDPGRFQSHGLPGRLFIFAALLLGLVTFTGHALAGDNGAAARAKAHTHSLVALNNRYTRATASTRQALLEELIGTAISRQQALMEMLQDNPGGVFKLALPGQVRYRMPDAVRTHLEQVVEVIGEYEAIYEDHDDGRFMLAQHLKTNGAILSVHFTGITPALHSGARIKAKGLLLGNARVDGTAGALVLADNSDSFLLLDDGSASGSGGSAASGITNSILGEQRTLVLLINFQDDTRTPWTVEDANNLVFTTTSDFFLENSYNQAWLAGDVHGWFTLPIDSTCSSYDINAAADAAATAAGIDMSAYDRYVYFFPRNTVCGWTGKATVGGNPSRAYINGRLELDVVSHELGHNFSLHHSHALECGADTLGADCQSMEYGDTFDTMGNVNAGHLNAFQKQQIGWLGSAGTPLITDITTDGNYSLSSIEAAGSGTSALRIPLGIDAATGQMSWYYIESRQALGFDSFLTGYANATNGVLVHKATDSVANSSYLLDMTPESNTLSSYFDWQDPALETGQSYLDSETGITITTVTGGSGGAVVDISFGTPVCSPANPGISMTPDQGTWVTAGTPVSFTVTLTNNDSLACAASTFTLSPAVPVGWSASAVNAAPMLAPGASSSTVMEVVSAAAAVDGFYDVSISATNNPASSYSASATSSYVIDSIPANLPPIAVDDAAVTLIGTPVAIDVLINDSDPDGDFLDVIGVTQGTRGTVSIGSDGTVIFTPSKKAKGTDTFTYTLSDGIHTTEAVVSVSIIRASGGGGGGGGGGGKGRR